MNSVDLEKEIKDLNKFLTPRHPSSVLQFITGMIVEWTHSGKEQPSSRSDVNLVWQTYFQLLRECIDKRASLISNRLGSNVREKVKRMPRPVYERKKLREVSTLLERMPPEDALHFMVEVTTNWCFSIPINLLPLFPGTPRAETDEAIADMVYEWLVGYLDLWH